MLFRDVVDLLVLEDGTNENGFPIITETSREQVFANKKSIKSSEFYLAAQSGFTLELMFEVRLADYQSQKFLEFESKKYKIIRTYEKNDWIELVCMAYGEDP